MAAAGAAAEAVEVAAVAAAAAAAALASTSAFPLTLAVAVALRAEVEGLKVGWRVLPDAVVALVVLAVVAVAVAVAAAVLVLLFVVGKIAGLENFGVAPPSLDAATRQTGRSWSPPVIPSRLKMGGRAGSDHSAGSDVSGEFPAIRKDTRRSEWL